MVEDLKMVKILTTIGGEVSILSRAPTHEIKKEIKENVVSDWISLDALDANDDRVEFEILRQYVVGYLIGKAHKGPPPQSPIALPRGVMRQ